jgi:hypothetical protein
MRRRTLDALLTTGGLIVAIVLLVAGGLLTWASNFVNDNVHSQLADQKITMPSGAAISDPQIKPYLSQYQGQALVNGEQAKAYADHYILVHMNKASGGRTYEEVSGEFIALNKTTNPDPAKVKELGSMLLQAYAFGTMAKIAFWGAVASFIGAGAMFFLSLLGFFHLRRVPAEQEVRLGHAAPSPA